MKSGQLIKTISSALGIEQSTVGFVARRLREAGFLTTGARGVNAPKMTTRDAARLTLAIMTGAPPNLVVETFKIYRQFRNDEFEHIKGANIIQLLEFKQDNTAEDFLTYLFDYMSSSRSNVDFRESLGGLEINVHEKPAYVIYKNSGLEVYFTTGHSHELDKLEIEGDMTNSPMPDITRLFEVKGMHVMRQISYREIKAIASKFENR